MNIKLTTPFLFISALLMSPAQAYWQGSWLIGASGSYGERSGDVDIQMVYTTNFVPVPLRTSYITEKYVDRGTIWGLFAGYQIRCNRFLVGLEANYDWDDMNNNAHDFAFLDTLAQTSVVVPPGNSYIATAQYERDPTFGVSCRFGYDVNPCFMPFIRIGGETSKDSLTLSFGGVPFLNSLSTTIKDSDRIYRLFGGVGAEISSILWRSTLLQPISFRVEYCVHAASDDAVEAVGMINDGTYSPLFVNKMKPVTHTGKISIVWNFI